MDTEVIIAGFGPVGAVAALALAQAGVDVVATETATVIPHDLRASTIHPPTLEMLDALGLADTLMAQGLRAPAYQYRDRRAEQILVFDLGELADRTDYPFRLQCEQYKLVGAAAASLEAITPGRVRFGTQLIDVTQDAESVTATVRTENGDETIKAQYLIAADGASSAVRRTLEVGFTGFTYPESFLCLSTALPLEERIEGLDYVNYVSDPDEWLVLLRAPSAWRVLLPVGEGDSADVLSDENKDGVFRRLLGSDEPVETLHRTLYRIHQRVADRFVVGRVALVGDAAHVNSPIGGYGMNSGIHDAVNLVDKLVAILRHGGGHDLLGRYERQRRTIAESFVQSQTKENTRAMREGWSTLQDDKRRTMATILANDELRRDFLLRQSMFRSIDDGRAID